MGRRAAPLALLALLLATPGLAAQAGEPAEFETSFMMVNQHLCPPENMDELMELAETQLGPALEQLKQDGHISEWGIMTHAWGDEYNFNFYFITDDMERFVTGAWPALLEVSNELDPEWFDRWAPLCDMHKDNLYNVRNYGS